MMIELSVLDMNFANKAPLTNVIATHTFLMKGFIGSNQIALSDRVKRIGSISPLLIQMLLKTSFNCWVTRMKVVLFGISFTFPAPT